MTHEVWSGYRETWGVGASGPRGQDQAARTGLTEDQERFVHNVFARHARPMTAGMSRVWSQHRPGITRTKRTNFQDVAVRRQPWESAGRPGAGPVASALREVSSRFLKETEQAALRKGAGSKVSEQRAAVALLVRSLDGAQSDAVHRCCEQRPTRERARSRLAPIGRTLSAFFGDCFGGFERRLQRRARTKRRGDVRTPAQVVAQYCQTVRNKLP